MMITLGTVAQLNPFSFPLSFIPLQTLKNVYIVSLLMLIFMVHQNIISTSSIYTIQNWLLCRWNKKDDDGIHPPFSFLEVLSLSGCQAENQRFLGCAFHFILLLNDATTSYRTYFAHHLNFVRISRQDMRIQRHSPCEYVWCVGVCLQAATFFVLRNVRHRISCRFARHNIDLYWWQLTA